MTPYTERAAYSGNVVSIPYTRCRAYPLHGLVTVSPSAGMREEGCLCGSWLMNVALRKDVARWGRAREAPEFAHGHRGKERA